MKVNLAWIRKVGSCRCKDWQLTPRVDKKWIFSLCGYRKLLSVLKWRNKKTCVWKLVDVDIAFVCVESVDAAAVWIKKE